MQCYCGYVLLCSCSGEQSAGLHPAHQQAHCWTPISHVDKNTTWDWQEENSLI